MVGFLQSGCTDPAVGLSRLCRVLDVLPPQWRTPGMSACCYYCCYCCLLLLLATATAATRQPDDAAHVLFPPASASLSDATVDIDGTLS